MTDIVISMKKLLLGVVLLIIGIGGAIVYQNNNRVSNPSSVLPSPSTELMYTLEEVAKHASKDDCWIGIEGKVYDVTSYVASGLHPGREKILLGCGRDATAMFNSRPDLGTSHSSRARALLSKYYIGELSDGMQVTGGRYVEYSPTVWEEAKQSKRVLYFYASWCPTCRPADADLRSNESKIPPGVTVIRVNYNDPETDAEEKKLASNYEITYQHTFVLVDSEGKVEKKWNGGATVELLSNLL